MPVIYFQFEQPGPGWMIISGVFLAAFLVQMFYSFNFYLRFLRYKGPKAAQIPGEPVSVVICARDESCNLEKNLPLVLTQNYPDFEVIVVNDCSADNTEVILGGLKNKFPNLKTTTIEKDELSRHGKKLALSIGLKAATKDWVLLTDADCRPSGPDWISQMQKHFIAPNDIVLGYGPYERKGGFLNKLIRYDTFFIALQYLSFALAGHPYMGVGRNLAYRRQLFFNNRGFASHLKLESGDDDLFINEVATPDNTTVEFSHPAHTVSIPHNSWKGFLRQKRRHLTTGFHYRGTTRFLLGAEYFSRLIFYASFLLLIINEIFLPYVAGLFIIRLVIYTIILNKGMNLLNEKNLLLFSPLFDLGILLLNVFCVAGNLTIQKRRRWR
jgi:poly-beta-1,6-N-acetyl-D-glucosamine synthase